MTNTQNFQSLDTLPAENVEIPVDSLLSSLNNERSLGWNIVNITFSLVFQHGSYTFFAGHDMET